MKRLMVGLFLVSLPGSGQSTPCSARAIFVGPQGAIAPSACMSTPVPQTTTATKGKDSKEQAKTKEKSASPSDPKGTPVAVTPVSFSTPVPMSALKYWIELLTPNGEKQRVTSERVFRSGERILIHFESSVTGRLTITSLRPDGSSQVLFPSSKVRAGDNLVQAKIDTAIPQSGQFRFDSEVGTERLMVFLNPGASPVRDNPALAGAIADGTINADATRELTQTVQTAKRGIFVETDSAVSEQYVAAPGILAIEIQLKHQ